MKYVYILESEDCEHFYVGVTDDLRTRLAKHNAGEVPHTSKYGPWRLRTYIAFDDEQRHAAVPERWVGLRGDDNDVAVDEIRQQTAVDIAASRK